MNEPGKHRERRRPQRTTACDSIYMTCPEQANVDYRTSCTGLHRAEGEGLEQEDEGVIPKGIRVWRVMEIF